MIDDFVTPRTSQFQIKTTNRFDRPFIRGITILLLMLRRATAQARYFAARGILALMATAPIVTGMWLATPAAVVDAASPVATGEQPRLGELSRSDADAARRGRVFDFSELQKSPPAPLNSCCRGLTNSKPALREESVNSDQEAKDGNGAIWLAPDAVHGIKSGRRKSGSREESFS